MKGVIMACLSQLVAEKFGQEKLAEIMQACGMDPHKIFMATEDVPEETAMKMLQSTCEALHITLQQAADAFGEYWVNVYAPKIYGIYYKNVDNARDFLTRMDEVHVRTTKSMENATPPRFDYDWEDEDTLIITYKSPRNLIDICIGLVKGVGKYYQENLEVTKLSNDKIKVKFMP
jgi:hypothetical protein